MQAAPAKPFEQRLVRFGFSLAMGLFGGVATVGMWPSLADAERREATADTLGGSIGEVLAAWRRSQDYFLDLADEAITLGQTLS